MSQNETKSRKAIKESKKKNKKFPWKKVLLSALIVGLIGFITVASIFMYYISDAPSLNADELQVPASTTILDRDGEEIAELGSQKRIMIQYDDISPLLEDAVLATEDARFYEHSGVDLRRIGAAVIANVTDGFGSQGASTITQQVIKGAFLTDDKQVKRKVQEQYLAFKLEQRYSKEEILTMYLNRIYYGNNFYGVAKASEAYFGKENLSELTLPEAALLAGLPQRPSAYNPYTNPDLAEERRNTVLNLMVHHGKITEQEAEEAKQVAVTDMLQQNYETEIPYDSFIERVLEETEDELGEEIDIYTSGLTIHTTLDQKAQQQAELLLSQDSPINFGDNELEAGIAAIDTKTGEILAIGGGRNKAEGIGAGLNYATNPNGRQPGSVIKPILAYGPAIENEQWSTYHQINDEEYSFEEDGDPISNAGRGYLGWMSMREALYRSHNVPAVKAFQEIGAGPAREFAEGLGLTTESELYDSNAIGGGDLQANPLQMAGAYTAFGNEGMYTEPYSVRKIEFSDGEELELNHESTVAMSDSTAYMITDMLKDVITHPNGTGQAAAVSGLPIAGKTGTTNDDHDSWFAGYSTNYTISVWAGYSQPDSIPQASKSVPQQIFSSLMAHMSEGVETSDFTMPDSVVEVDVEKGSRPAALPSEYTPESEIVTELFVSGYEPSETSETYDQVGSPQNFNAEFVPEEQIINLSWSPPSEEDREFEYELSVSVDDSEMQTITTTSDTEMVFDEISMGSTYTFELVAVDASSGDNRSEPVTASAEIPEEDSDFWDEFFGDDEEDEENEEEENQEEEQDEENQEDEDQGNGNGDGSDNGDGDGSGEGSNDGSDDGDSEDNTDTEDDSTSDDDSEGDDSTSQEPDAETDDSEE